MPRVGDSASVCASVLPGGERRSTPFDSAAAAWRQLAMHIPYTLCGELGSTASRIRSWRAPSVLQNASGDCARVEVMERIKCLCALYLGGLFGGGSSSKPVIRRELTWLAVVFCVDVLIIDELGRAV